MSNTIHTPVPPPSCPEDAKPATLTSIEEELYKKVLDHFSKPDYTIPGEKDGVLSELERFWLVWRYFLCALFTDNHIHLSSPMSVFCGVLRFQVSVYFRSLKFLTVIFAPQSGQ
jgi:hypothetical protein